MPSTYSKGTAIELIATGEKSGTWGDSTNENLRKIDQALTQYAEVNISDVASPSTWVFSSNTLVWTLDDSSIARAEGSEGRAKFVQFNAGSGTTDTAPNGNVSVSIKGESSAIFPPRIFYVKNNISYNLWFYVDNGTAPGTASKSFEVKPGEVVPIITYIDESDASNNYVTTLNTAPFIHTLYMTDRSQGQLSGSVQQFVMDADSHSNWLGANTVAIGKDAGKPAVGTTTQIQDVFIGSLAGASAAGAVDSVFIGYKAGNAVTSADRTTAIGSQAGECLTTLNSNTAIGYQAIQGFSTSEALGYNTAIGLRAMGYGRAGANNNTCVGYLALEGDPTLGLTGDNNVAIGNSAGDSVSTGRYNTFVGSMVAATGPGAGVGITGDFNTGVGSFALLKLSSGEYNVALGDYAGHGLTTQDKNILIGYSVGYTTTGADSILIIDHEDKTSAQSTTQFIYGDMANDLLNFNSDNSTGSHVKIQNTTAATDAYDFLECLADGVSQFTVKGDGDVYVKAVKVHGADYADMFEWSDGNPEAEDRIGLTVVVDGGLSGGVRPATSSDDPEDVVGVVSGTACMIGNTAWSHWDSKFLKDGFGRVVTRTVDEKPTATINPDFEESREYIPRMARSDWAVIGMTGRIHIRKGAPVHPSWRKLRDVSAVTEEWLVR